MTTKRTIDARLTRDPRYAAAKARLTDLSGQLAATERERTELQDGLGSLASVRASDPASMDYPLRGIGIGADHR